MYWSSLVWKWIVHPRSLNLSSYRKAPLLTLVMKYSIVNKISFYKRLPMLKLTPRLSDWWSTEWLLLIMLGNSKFMYIPLVVYVHPLHITTKSQTISVSSMFWAVSYIILELIVKIFCLLTWDFLNNSNKNDAKNPFYLYNRIQNIRVLKIERFTFIEMLSVNHLLTSEKKKRGFQ